MVILGAVTAQITRWCLVGAQPATVGLGSHRAGGLLQVLGRGGVRSDVEPPVAVEDHPAIAWVEPVGDADGFEVDPLEIDLLDETVPVAVVETTATSWLSRARALVGLTVVVSTLGTVLAIAVASTALLTAAVLDSALG